MGLDKQVEDKYIAVQRKGAVRPLLLHIVGDLLFERIYRNINEDEIQVFQCFYMQIIACPRKKYRIIERLKSKEYVIPLFIPQAY